MKIKIGIFIFFSLICNLGNISYGTENYNFDEAKIDNKIIDNHGMYSLIDTDTIPSSNFRYGLGGNLLLQYLPSRYSIQDDIDVNIYNQGQTNSCWIYAANSMVETTRTKEQQEDFTYGVSYVEENISNVFNMKKEQGGRPDIILSFYTNGYGPLTNETKQIDTQIGDYVLLSTIYKSTDSNGNKIYNDGKYTEEQVITIRNKIKQHIKEHGAVVAPMYTNVEKGALQYFNESTLETYGNSDAYYCDYNFKYEGTNDILPDHQITIIGWDDNYSKENFNEAHRPKNDGAYIVLNSWGDKFSDDGIFYISYEDTYIESDVYGISNVDDKDYDNLYQYDENGLVDYISIENIEMEYGANVFTRKTSEPELLTEVSVANKIETQYEIYVNPSSGDLDFDELIKVADTDILPTGMHTIEIDKEIILTGDKFAIVVKYKNDSKENNSSCFGIESTLESVYKYEIFTESPYLKAEINSGESYLYDASAKQWIDLTTIKNNTSSNGLKDMCNLCIKGFTKEYIETSDDGIISSKVYKIQDKFIKAPVNTTKKEFLSKITTNSYDMEVYHLASVVNDSDIIKTGMQLVLTKDQDSVLYTIVAIGDSNGDGKVNANDLIAAVKKYKYDKSDGKKGANIIGEALLAIKFSDDIKYSPQDLIQQVKLYKASNSKE